MLSQKLVDSSFVCYTQLVYQPREYNNTIIVLKYHAFHAPRLHHLALLHALNCRSKVGLGRLWPIASEFPSLLAMFVPGSLALASIRSQGP